MVAGSRPRPQKAPVRRKTTAKPSAHDQAEVIGFLSDAASYAGVDRVETFQTHGNLVFLAGREAWKIKRAVKLPYMDFSTLEKRHAACAREAEVNRAFAPELYLGCVPIRRSPAGTLTFGGSGETVEWAVHMRRFEQDALLSTIAKREGIASEMAKALADVVYELHAVATHAQPSSGTAPVRRLLAALAGALSRSQVFNDQDLRRFSQAAERQLDKAAAILDERARRGCVRRCHGDVHLANIVMWQGRPVLYDAIEFDEAIATVDTLYDLAFLLMDLDRYGQRPAANLVLNRYLWRSQADLDLAGLAALPLFLALRSAVRAMVTVDRAANESESARQRDLDRARAGLATALSYLDPPAPSLVAVGGVSGTGKTTLATALAPRLGASPGAVHLRSDLERKALAGVGELDRLPDAAYTPGCAAAHLRRAGGKSASGAGGGAFGHCRCRLCGQRGAPGHRGSGGRPRRPLSWPLAHGRRGKAGRPRQRARQRRLGRDGGDGAHPAEPAA